MNDTKTTHITPCGPQQESDSFAIRRSLPGCGDDSPKYSLVGFQPLGNTGNELDLPNHMEERDVGLLPGWVNGQTAFLMVGNTDTAADLMQFETFGLGYGRFSSDYGTVLMAGIILSDAQIDLLTWELKFDPAKEENLRFLRALQTQEALQFLVLATPEIKLDNKRFPHPAENRERLKVFIDEALKHNQQLDELDFEMTKTLYACWKVWQLFLMMTRPNGFTFAVMRLS